MLDGIAKEHPEYGAALIYNNLRPEHTYQLLDLPLVISFELASLTGGLQVAEIAKKIWLAESNNNLNLLADAANRLNHFLLLATSPTIDSKSIKIEDLALCLTNYIILRYALFQYLSKGEREISLPWSETIRWSDLPKENRVSHFLSMRWVSMIILYMDRYLDQLSPALAHSTDEFRETLRYPIYPIVPDEDKEDENILGQAVALHRKNQDYYQLWLRFLINGEKDFYFEPIWDKEAPYLETLVNLLADIELEARNMAREFSTIWNEIRKVPAEIQQNSSMDVFFDETRDDIFLKHKINLPSYFLRPTFK
jgi:hypothetical protein